MAQIPTDRQEGFFVIQESPDGWSEFFSHKQDAEKKAVEMLRDGHRMFIIRATAFTTRDIEKNF